MPEKEGQRLRIITLLNILWGYYPQERLGQLLVNTFGSNIDVFYASDDLFEEELLKEIANAKDEGLIWTDPV